MSENEVDTKKEIFSLVFDPYTDFKNTHSASSPELFYFGSVREDGNLSRRTENNVNAIDNIKYTFNEEPSSWQLIKSISSILNSKTGTYNPKEFPPNPLAATNSTLAQVHRFKFPSHYMRSNYHSLVSCPTNNAVVSSHLIGDFVSSSHQQQDQQQQPRNSQTRFGTYKFLGNFLHSRHTSDLLVPRDGGMEPSSPCHPLIQPTIHTFPNQPTQCPPTKMDSNKCYPAANPLQLLTLQGTAKPHLIIVPRGDQSGHQHEIIREVYRYPPGSIQTVVEKKTFSKDGNSNCDRSNRTTKNVKRKTRNDNNKKKLHCSQSLMASSGSAVSSKSLSSLPSQTDSALSCDSIPNVSEPYFLRPDHLSDCNGPFVHKFNDRCEPDLVSDSSSNISTMSDLSGYEDEYTSIKRLISDGAHSKAFVRKTAALHSRESVGRKSYIETRIQEQDSTIKSLHTYREDLEIQVHRLSTQLHNAVREKEVCQEQLEMMQTKLTEKNQQEYFELLKEKVNLEGQYETLKQEFQHCSMGNSELAAKLHQTEIEAEKYDKERLKLLGNETELKEEVSSCEKQKLGLENELKAANEILALERNNCLSLRTEMRKKENDIIDVRSQIEGHAQQSDNYEETVQNLKKWNLEYSEREEQQRQEKRKIENLLSESTGKLNTLKENSEWFQAQLNKAQKMQAELQNELGETKSTFTVVSSDRDRCKREVERLSSEIEDNRAKAVRDKSLLLVQLEELEADMREREAMIRQLEEGDKVTQVKLSEDRFKRLEEDHKRLQELKIEFREVLRHKDSLKDELKHKSLMLRRHEEAVHDLRKDLAVSQEELGSKQVCIDSLTDKLNKAKLKLGKVASEAKESDGTVTQLKEHNLKIEATLLTAEDDKKQVNETVARLKEDMSKLSSNFFRMKHDLSAKDKQIEILSSHNSQLSLSEQELLSKSEHLSKQLKEYEDGKIHQNEMTSLQQSLKTSNSEYLKVKEEVSQLRKTVESFEVGKKSMTNALHLRDEQIDNIQGVIGTYKEKILQKDEEIYTRKDHLSKFEKSHSDLQKRLNFLNNEYQMNLQERDEFHELEINYKNSITELKECIKFEKKSKENHEKNHKETMVELANTKKLLKEKMEVAETVSHMKTELEKEKDNVKQRDEEITKIKTEIDIRTNDKLKLENQIRDFSIKLEKSKKIAENGLKEALKLKEDEVSGLEETLSSKQLEIDRLQSTLVDKEKETTKKVANALRHHTNVDRNIGKQNAKRAAKSLTRKDEELGHLKQRLKESSNKLARQAEEIEGLTKLRGDYEAQKTTMTSSLEDVRTKIEAMQEENERLRSLCTSTQEELGNNQSLLLLRGRECEEWKLRYENLVDTIPQRDTNTHQATTVDQTHTERSDLTLPFPQEEKELLQVQESMLQDFNLEEKLKFTETMTYLQGQISLTAEALQNKDRQIIELNERLSHTIRSKSTVENHLEKSSSILNRQDVSGNTIDGIGINFPKILPSQAEASYIEASSSTINFETDTKDLEEKEETAVKDEENSRLIEELKTCLSTKESAFKEKQRRYESNVRLLTRKLKEHMKGRRNAERELEVLMKGSEESARAEQKRCEVLKNRCIDLEKKCDHLVSALSSSEASRVECEVSLRGAEEDLGRERTVVLRMQKEVGQQEELRQYLDDSRAKTKTLAEELMSRSKASDEAGRALQSSLKQRESLEHKERALTSRLDDLDRRLAEERAKVTKRDQSLKSREEELSNKNEDISILDEKIGSLQLNCSNLQESLQRVQREDGGKCRRMESLREEVEVLRSSVEGKEALVEDLRAKAAVLEAEIRLKEESVSGARAESDAAFLRLRETEEKGAAQVAVLEARLADAKDAESRMGRRLASVHKEKMAYQAQATQLRVALNSAVAKLQTSTPHALLPSPSPLNTESLSQLMEQCSRPPPSNARLANSLSERLNSLREEVSVLQSGIKARDLTDEKYCSETSFVNSTPK